jgi:hypothetical protein
MIMSNLLGLIIRTIVVNELENQDFLQMLQQVLFGSSVHQRSYIGAAILSNVAYNIIYPVCPSIFLKQHSLKSPLLSLRSPPPIYMIQLCIHTFSGVAIRVQGVAF